MSHAAADLLSVAIEELVEQFAPLLRATARRYRIVDDEAEELRQDVRIRLWRVIVHGGAGPPCPAYCRRLVTSAAADIMRRRQWGRVREPQSIDPVIGPAAESLLDTKAPDRVMECHELERQVARSVSALAPPRDVVVRLYLAGFGRLEIAERLAWSEPKVRNLLYRGLHDLRSILVDQGLAPASRAREGFGDGYVSMT